MLQKEVKYELLKVQQEFAIGMALAWARGFLARSKQKSPVASDFRRTLDGILLNKRFAHHAAENVRKKYVGASLMTHV